MFLGYKRRRVLSSSFHAALRAAGHTCGSFAFLPRAVFPFSRTFKDASPMAKTAALLLCSLFVAGALRAQNADPQLLAEINKIKAIDNHSHPPKLVASGEKDDDFDALPCDTLEPSNPTTISRPENPQFLAAWKALYGYKYDDRSPEHVRELLAAKQKVMQEQGDT